jgi:hypothetical protein
MRQFKKFIRVQAKGIRIVKQKGGRFSLEVTGLLSIERNPQHSAEWFPLIGPWRDPPTPHHPVSSAGCVADVSIYTPWPPVETQPNPSDTNPDNPGSSAGHGSDDTMEVNCKQGADCQRSCAAKVQQSEQGTDVWCNCE